jgi:hypothetical protein
MGRASNNGFSTTVLTANTAGTQIFLTGPSGSASVPQAEGFLGSITISADSTANTISCYDGTSTGGTLRYKVVTPTTTPVIQLFPNIQFNSGLFIVVSGGTSVNISLGWE